MISYKLFNSDITEHDIVCFDLEAYTAYIGDDGSTHRFDFSKDKDFYLRHKLVANVYLWMLSVNEKVYYGRDILEFKDCVENIVSHAKCEKIVIWVHNLAYEYQWLLNCFKFEHTFAVKQHKVIYADTTVNGIIVEFRCSYFLTRLSLDDWAREKKLPVKKKTGRINYNVPRTPKSPLTKKMMEYGESDVLVMYYGLMEYIEIYGSIKKIPWTQTGRVRKALKDKVKKKYKYHDICTNLVPENSAIYMMLRECFAGGHTHASYIWSGKVLDDVHSNDLTSAYPFNLCSRKFPMTKWTKCTKSWEKLYKDFSHALMLDVTLIGVESTKWCTYISRHKCYQLENAIYDNGKIISCSKASLYMTDLDLRAIEMLYEIEEIVVNDAYCSKYGYLPKSLVEFVLELYKSKTELKDTEFEQLYRDKKEMANSTYGMMVTAILHLVYDVDDNGRWIEPHKYTTTEVEEKLESMKQKPWQNFLAYQWGVWCPAWTRYTNMQAIAQLNRDYVYDDTDSVKYIGKHDDIFDSINAILHQCNVDASEHFELPFDMWNPCDKNGVHHELGLYESEKTADKFVTLGSKRYCGQYGEELKITVSGVNKKKGVKALKGDINNFNMSLVFDYKTSGKKLLQYNNAQGRVIWHNGYISEYNHVVTMIPTTYSMDFSVDYFWLLLAMVNARDEIFGFKSALDMRKEIKSVMTHYTKGAKGGIRK